VKLNSSGVIEWQKSLGGSIWDEAAFIQQTTDGGFILAGESQSNDGDVTGHHGITDYYDYWIVKLSPDDGISEHFTPQKFAISVSPNPFNSSCAISAPTGAKIEICDLRGGLVGRFDKLTDRSGNPVIEPVEMTDNRLPMTEYIWTPEKEIGSGIYFVRVKIGEQTITKRVVYLR
jgi:hypothetical protein